SFQSLIQSQQAFKTGTEWTKDARPKYEIARAEVFYLAIQNWVSSSDTTRVRIFPTKEADVVLKAQMDFVTGDDDKTEVLFHLLLLDSTGAVSDIGCTWDREKCLKLAVTNFLVWNCFIHTSEQSLTESSSGFRLPDRGPIGPDTTIPRNFCLPTI